MTTGFARGCPDDNDLAQLLSGSLAPERVELLNHHVDRCGACTRLLTELGATFTSVEGALASDNGSDQSRYRLVERIGSGGMGVVYEAEDLELGRRVALKLLKPDIGSETQREARRGRLLREARLLARLQHPNVIAVHDVGALGDQVFIALELVRGQTATTWCAQSARSWRAVLSVFVAAGDGLAAAHEAGQVHRDVKPDNVLVGDSGRVWITDFGLAGLESAATAEDDASAGRGSQIPPETPTLTQTGELLGTPAYMAPEQLRGRIADARSDQFSFAAMVWQGIFGQRPFPGDTVAEISRGFSRGSPAEPSGKDATGTVVPPSIRAVLERALSIEPSHRHSDVQALLDELNAAARAASTADHPRRRTAARSVLPALGVAAAAALALVVTWRLTGGADKASLEPAVTVETTAPADAGSRPSEAVLDVDVDAMPPAAIATARSPDKRTSEGTRPAAERGPLPQPAPPARSIQDDSPPPSPAPTATTTTAWKTHYDNAQIATYERDARRCLRELDAADNLRPATTTVAARGICEMISGRCEDGLARVSPTLTVTGDMAARALRNLDAQYCDAASGTLERRMERLAMQAAMAAFVPNERVSKRLCKRLTTLAKGAIKAAPASKLPAPTRSRLLKSLLMSVYQCEVKLGRCADAEQHYVAAFATDDATVIEQSRQQFRNSFRARCPAGGAADEKN